jgi:putative ABC transport system permease protein
MLELVLANLRTRPFRTFISIVGVSLGVILVVLFTGLARGMSNDMAKRASNWKAEVVFTKSGAMELQSSNTPIDVRYGQKLLEIEGVESVVPVIRDLITNNTARWGLQQIDGVDWEPFAEMNDMNLVEGRAATANDEIVVDQRQLSNDNKKIGDTIKLYGGREFKIVGVFSPPSGARIKMSLGAMQEIRTTPGKCSFILVKIKDGANAEQVAKTINETYPGNKVNLTKELAADAQEKIPALNTFLKVLVGLGAFVSTIFVLLSMYTTITERKKEIGILKSLGASKLFIIKVIEGEAFMVGVLGTLLGFAVSFLTAFIISNLVELVFEFSWGWILTAIAIAVGGSLFGALYPAWKASDIDPVLVLTNE